MIIIGIDCGVTGAIAILDGQTAVVNDMPVATVGKTRKRSEVMAGELCRILDVYDAGDCLAYIEEVSAMPGQGVSSMFGFGVSYGIVRGVLAGLYISTTLVSPQAWKRHHGLIGTDKDAARAVASRLFPGASLARKKDVGRADALLIAAYGASKSGVNGAMASGEAA